MRKFAALAFLIFPGCATGDAGTAPSDGVATAAIGETVRVGSLRVTLLRVIEDSRCPASVQCIQAGRVRIAARIEPGEPGRELVLTSGEPLAVGRRWLSLYAVCPIREEPGPIRAQAYGFTFGYFADPAARPVDVVCAPST